MKKSYFMGTLSLTGFICVAAAYLSILFYYQKSDWVLNYYIPRSCEVLSKDLARKSCGEYPNQLSYAEAVLKFSVPTAAISGVVFVLLIIYFKFIKKDYIN